MGFLSRFFKRESDRDAKDIAVTEKEVAAETEEIVAEVEETTAEVEEAAIEAEEITAEVEEAAIEVEETTAEVEEATEAEETVAEVEEAATEVEETVAEVEDVSGSVYGDEAATEEASEFAKFFSYSCTGEQFDAYITEAEFPGYTIERNVHVSRFDSSAHPKCYPVSYLFNKNGAPALAVLFMGVNQRRAMIARGAYEVLDKNGISYVRFYSDFANEKDYVINRIREKLN